MSVAEPEFMALVLADALALGDPAAASKWNISTRSVRRYRAQMKTDAALAALVQQKNAEVSRDLAELRVSFMREALAVLRGKLHGANVRSVAGALKVVGELHIAATVMDDERPAGGDSESESEPGTAGQAPRLPGDDAGYARAH